jgi:DUF4097 and DUF4098 domain-containing protein YvlB
MARYRRVQTITHDIGSTGSFFLSVTSADIQMSGTAGDRVEVKATFEVKAASETEADKIFEAIQLDVESGPGRLRVAEQNGARGLEAAVEQLLGGNRAALEDVIVTAPAGATIDVRSVSGDLHGSGFRGPVRIQTVSGDARLEKAGGELDMDSVSGDVAVRGAEPISLKANTVSGDLTAESPLFRMLKANAVSGDISIDGSLAVGPMHRIDTVSGDVRLASSSDMTIQVHALSSDIRASLPHRIEGRADLRRLIIGDGAVSVNFSSMSGDINVTGSKYAPAPEPAPAAPSPKPADGDARLAILSALEKGEISVDEAMQRLEGRS